MTRKSRASVGGDSVNIQVAVRVRPLGGSSRADDLLKLRDNSLSLVNPTSGQKEGFSFDFLYGQDSTQTELFEDLGAQILDYAFNGYNGTIFA